MEELNVFNPEELLENGRDGFCHKSRAIKCQTIDEVWNCYWDDCKAKLRPDLPYEIDGMVIKVNDLPLKKNIYFRECPRWALRINSLQKQTDCPRYRVDGWAYRLNANRGWHGSCSVTSRNVLRRASLHNIDCLLFRLIGPEDVVIHK